MHCVCMRVCLYLCVFVCVSACNACASVYTCVRVFVQVGRCAVQIICSNDRHQERRAQGRRNDTSNICFVSHPLTKHLLFLKKTLVFASDKDRNI